MYHESDEFEKGAKTEEVAAELRAQIERAKLLGLTPSHIDNHMGSLYGVQTGRFDLLPVVFEIAAEYGLPFRFPSVFDKRMFGNETLDISIPMEMVQLLFDQIVNMAKSKGIAMPDYLMPHDFNGPQKDSYENFSDYMHEFIKAFPEGVTETYLHPAFESDELKVNGVEALAMDIRGVARNTSAMWPGSYEDAAASAGVESLNVK